MPPCSTSYVGSGDRTQVLIFGKLFTNSISPSPGPEVLASSLPAPFYWFFGEQSLSVHIAKFINLVFYSQHISHLV